MLLLDKISTITPYSLEWFLHRRGVMTGSMISPLCASEGIGVGAMTYIRNKVYEKLTEKTTEKNIVTEDTIWGIDNEPIAMDEWKAKEGFFDVVTDKHIIFNKYYSVTPDGLAIRTEKGMYIKNGTELVCESAEIKCFPTPSKHMAHVECETPEDIYKLNKPLFWQVISQVSWCGIRYGHAIFFHPDFDENSPYRLSSVKFDYADPNLIPYFKLFNTRTRQAELIYEEKLNYKKPTNA